MDEQTAEELWTALLNSEPGAKNWHYSYFVRDDVPEHICREAWRLTLIQGINCHTLRDVVRGCSLFRQHAAQLMAADMNGTDLAISIDNDLPSTRSIAEAVLDYLEDLELTLWERFTNWLLGRADPRRLRCNWAVTQIMRHFTDLRGRAWKQLKLDVVDLTHLTRVAIHCPEFREQAWQILEVRGIGMYELKDIARVPELLDRARRFLRDHNFSEDQLLWIGNMSEELREDAKQKLFNGCDDPVVFAKWFRKVRELDEMLWQTFLSLDPSDVVLSTTVLSGFSDIASEELLRRNCTDPDCLAEILDFGRSLEYRKQAASLIDLNIASERALWLCIRTQVRMEEAVRCLIERFTLKEDDLQRLANKVPEMADEIYSHRRPKTDAVIDAIFDARRRKSA